MYTKTKLLVALSIFFGFCFNAQSQEKDAIKHYNFFDQSVGIENTPLYQGVLYREEYRTNKKKSEYFINYDFIKGSVVYDGLPYDNIDLKYDVKNDRVLIKLTDIAGGGTLVLFNTMLQSFKINGVQFMKLYSSYAPEVIVDGFYEVSEKSERVTLYTKYKKKDVKRTDKKLVYHEFEDRPSTYILFYQNAFHPFNSKKEVKRVFPEFKSEIDKFYTLTRGLKKSNPEGFKVALVNRLETLIDEKEN